MAARGRLINRQKGAEHDLHGQQGNGCRSPFERADRLSERPSPRLPLEDGRGILRHEYADLRTACGRTRYRSRRSEARHRECAEKRGQHQRECKLPQRGSSAPRGGSEPQAGDNGSGNHKLWGNRHGRHRMGLCEGRRLSTGERTLSQFARPGRGGAIWRTRRSVWQLHSSSRVRSSSLRRSKLLAGDVDEV